MNRSTTKKERDACFQDASTQTEEPFAPLFDEIAMKLAVEKDMGDRHYKTWSIRRNAMLKSWKSLSMN